MNSLFQIGRSCLRCSKAQTKTTGMSILALVALSLLAGCGGGSTVSTIPTASLPTVSAATPTNTYTGTQSPGLWSFTLDDSQNAFSYQATTYPATPNVATTGTTVALNGFSKLTSGASAAAGYAVEDQSRAFLLRPGDNTTAMIAGVKQDSCFAVTGRVTFHFVYLPSEYNEFALVQGTRQEGYGTVVASTSTDGSTWSFGNYAGGADSSKDPSLFSGTCAVANGQAAVTVTQDANNTMPATISVNQAGYIFIDHSIASPNKSSNQPELSQFGIVQPSSALTASSVIAKTYAGFLYEPGSSDGTTQPISFGTVTAGSGTSIVGGVYPSDDITQTPDTETTITLGKQNSTNYGFYPSATITRPDPKGECSYSTSQGTAGVDANGNATCTFLANVVVGSPNGKYAIFVSAFDPTLQLTMGIYLFQQ